MLPQPNYDDGKEQAATRPKCSNCHKFVKSEKAKANIETSTTNEGDGVPVMAIRSPNGATNDYIASKGA